eukprot:14712-Pelagococcus_subviridis.AAC.4
MFSHTHFASVPSASRSVRILCTSAGGWSPNPSARFHRSNRVKPNAGPYSVDMSNVFRILRYVSDSSSASSSTARWFGWGRVVVSERCRRDLGSRSEANCRATGRRRGRDAPIAAAARFAPFAPFPFASFPALDLGNRLVIFFAVGIVRVGYAHCAR